jgi:hypothetical protein
MDAPETTWQHRFNIWKNTPGGARIMQDLYQLANQYGRVWKRTGIPVSIALLYEIERQRIKTVTARAQSRGVKLKKEYGYTLNNSLRAYIARHIMANRKDLDGLFDVCALRSDPMTHDQIRTVDDTSCTPEDLERARKKIEARGHYTDELF